MKLFSEISFLSVLSVLSFLSALSQTHASAFCTSAQPLREEKEIKDYTAAVEDYQCYIPGIRVQSPDPRHDMPALTTAAAVVTDNVYCRYEYIGVCVLRMKSFFLAIGIHHVRFPRIMPYEYTY